MKQNQAKQEAAEVRPVVDQLLVRLSERGVLPVQVPRFVKDVLTLVNDSPFLTLAFVNRRLEGLGWGDNMLDEFTLELILYLLENQEARPSGESVGLRAF